MTLIKLKNKISLACYTSKPWNSSKGELIKDSAAILLNLKSGIFYSAKDHPDGGIYCCEKCGPGFGKFELLVNAPFLAEGKFISLDNEKGF